MNAAKILERISKLPRSQRLLVFGVLYLLLVAAYIGALYMPASEEMDTLAAEERTLLTQRAQIDERIKNKATFEAELQQLTADLKQALRELPNDREIPGLLKGISTTGKKVGLEVKKFQPLPEVRREFVADVPVALEVEGAYHEVALFFDRLAKMNRIVYVQDVEMAKPIDRAGKTVLTVKGTAVTFRFLTEQEMAAEVAPQDGKRGKKRGGG
jgi:type IV pilus assembly protein PilO